MQTNMITGLEISSSQKEGMAMLLIDFSQDTARPSLPPFYLHSVNFFEVLTSVVMCGITTPIVPRKGDGV